MSQNTKQKLSQAAKQPFFSLSSGATVKVSALGLALNPLKLLGSRWQYILKIALPAALVLSVVSLLFQRSILCGSEQDLSLLLKMCSDSVGSFYGDLFCRFLIFTLFAAKWYQFALEQKPVTVFGLLKIGWREIKTAAIIALFLIINLLPLLGLFILFIRKVNPDWKIELLFFTSVAWVFLLPLLAVRFYSVIAFIAGGEPCPSLKKIWNNTAGNMLKLLLSAAVIVFLALFTFMQYYGVIHGLAEVTVMSVIVAEFEYDVLAVLFVALCINYCSTQKELLFTGENNED